MKHDKDVDGGYAWFILAAAFTVMFMVGMMAYSAGVINIALLEEIDADIARTSWVGATLLGTFTLTGPLAGFLTKILGCRISCFSGGILLFIGLVAAAFVSDVTALIATYGIVGGLGMGLALNSSVVVSGYYFRLKRGVAFGVAVSGAGFGMFAGGPLVRCLIEEYKLSGCFLVLGAIQANICVAACILRPSTALISKTREINNKEGITWTKDSDSDSSKPDYEGCSFKKDEIENYNDSIKLEECLDGSKTTYMNCLDKSVIETDSLLTGKLYVQQEEDNPAHNDTQTKEDVCTRPLAGIRSKSCDDSSCSGFAIQTCWRRASRVNINNKYGFLCYNLSVLLWTMGEAACLFHLPNYAASKGSSKTQAASLFTVMGLSSIFSRILAGFAGNDSSIGPLIIHTGLLGLEGTVTLLFPLFSNSYGKQMVFSAVFGMYSGGPNSLMSLITIALVGLKNLPLGIGVGHFCCGFGFLLGPPIASFIYTESGRYDFTFVFAGAVLLFASLFGLMTGFFRGDAEAAPLVDLVKENDVNSPINKSKLHA